MQVYLALGPAEHKSVLSDNSLINEEMNLLFPFNQAKEYDLLKGYNNTNLLVDSGAFTYQDKQVSFEKINKFVLNYRKFILRTQDDPRIKGYFDMDILWLGYDNIHNIRDKLMEVSDKIIPVWHKEWGVKKFMEMCKEYDYIGIPCAKSIEIKQNSLKNFVRYAHKNNCKIHGLGESKQSVLEKVPFDSVDAATWVNTVIFAYYGSSRVRLDSDYVRNNRDTILQGSFIQHLQRAKYYHKKWKWYHND